MIELILKQILQIDIGDLGTDKGRCSSAGSNILSEALDKFYPVRYQESASEEEKDLLELSLAEKWRGLAGKSVTDCVRILLTCTRKWQFFGATLFEVQVIFIIPFSNKHILDY